MDTKITAFNREESLKTSFNCFWNNFFSNSIDYYSQFDLNNLLNLKGALSSINNIITLKLTFQAAKFLFENEIILPDDYNILRVHINKVKPNANGYDIEEEFDSCSIIAEVKSSLPCGPKINNAHESDIRLYGSNQLNNILKDIEALSKGKNRIKNSKVINKCLKFMFVLNCNKLAIEQIIKRSKNAVKIYQYSDRKSLTTDVVYIVPLEPH